MLKKFISLLLTAAVVFSAAICVNAVSFDEGKSALTAQFAYDSGPNVDGYSIDYRYFSPISGTVDEEVSEEETTTDIGTNEGVNEKETSTDTDMDEEEASPDVQEVGDVNECGDDDVTGDDNTDVEPTRKKYPLVVWIHGHSFGWYDGYQIEATNISYWASEEYQSRFADAGGAYIMAVRAPEDEGISWNEDLVKPLKYAIDDFILRHSDTLDTTKIYIGGFSLGGEMTFNMCSAYPDMFAAAFPICPHIKLNNSDARRFAAIPVWLVSGRNDAVVSYSQMTLRNWKAVCNTTLAAESCRFSTLDGVREPDGSRAPNQHHSWIAVTNDMFSSSDGDYPNMTTVNGLGETVELTYPNGMISWLSEFSSEYSTDDIDISDTGSTNRSLTLFQILKAVFMRIYIPLRNITRVR